MFSRPLLSIFIPTKNGGDTIYSAVKSVLSIDRDDLELIVHHCGDKPQFGTSLSHDFKNDSRLRYIHTFEKLSMTDNFNKAIEKCSGKYICGIGDDDAILPNIMRVADWMAENSVHAVRQPMSNYFWPDARSSYLHNGKLVFNKSLDGRVEKIDFRRNYKNNIVNCGFGYTEGLPSVYHALINLDSLDRYKKNTGKYLNGTSFDVYSAYAYVDYIKSVYFVNYPFSICGASSQSNTMKNINGKSVESHYSEFQYFSAYEYLPDLRSCEVSTAESMLEALADSGNEKLIETIDLAVIYGKCAAENPKLFFSLVYVLRKIKNRNNSILSFLRNFYFFFTKKSILQIKHLVARIFKKLTPFFFDYIVKNISTSNIVEAPDIGQAAKILHEYMTLNEVTLGNFDVE